MGDLQINAGKRLIGSDLRCGKRVLIGGIGGPASRVEIGDNVCIGDDVRILAGDITIGDYTVIHNHTVIYGYSSVAIGACNWIGQNVILNCTAPLTIGRGCTISALSNIWTHFGGGDPLQGCRYDSVKPATLGDDVWIGVQASMAPVAIGNRALVLAGSIVTRDIGENRVVGGNPAADLTDKLGPPYTDRPDAEKFERLCKLLREFHARNASGGHASGEAQDGESGGGRLTLGGITVAMEDTTGDGTSVFDVRDRTYSKLRTRDEIGFMHFLLPKIKFYPRTAAGG